MCVCVCVCVCALLYGSSISSSRDEDHGQTWCPHMNRARSQAPREPSLVTEASQTREGKRKIPKFLISQPLIPQSFSCNSLSLAYTKIMSRGVCLCGWLFVCVCLSLHACCVSEYESVCMCVCGYDSVPDSVPVCVCVFSCV